MPKTYRDKLNEDYPEAVKMKPSGYKLPGDMTIEEYVAKGGLVLIANSRESEEVVREIIEKEKRSRSREIIMEVNLDKLKKRFPEGFSSQRSMNREEGDV
jgi:hypothetical protein